MSAPAEPLSQALRELRCFYCERLMVDRSEYERDHFPAPRGAGGMAIVLACIRCHDEKDRLGDQELGEEAARCIRESPPHVVHLQRDFLDSAEDGVPGIAARTLKRIWPALPRVLRICDARILADLYRTAAQEIDVIPR
ncbi:MAG: hypothetical protein JSR67_03865 [Proteobacteria bacterium]|nr:hypothetical protein [Pseudomonadota bacterium]